MLAAGAWTGRLVAESGLASGQGLGSATAWAAAFQPRRGHLLELACPPGMAPLTCGLMEASYVKVSPWEGMPWGTVLGHRMRRSYYKRLDLADLQVLRPSSGMDAQIKRSLLNSCRENNTRK